MGDEERQEELPAAPDLTPPPAESEPSDELRSDSTNWAMGAHLSALSSLIGIPFGYVLGPLVIWLIKRDEDPFVERHAKEALNFNISLTVYGLALFLLGFVLLVVVIGLAILLLAVLYVIVVFFVWLVLTIMAAIKAARGEEYEYPFNLRFIS